MKLTTKLIIKQDLMLNLTYASFLGSPLLTGRACYILELKYASLVKHRGVFRGLKRYKHARISLHLAYGIIIICIIFFKLSYVVFIDTNIINIANNFLVVTKKA